MSPSQQKVVNLAHELLVVVIAFFGPIHNLLGFSILVVFIDFFLGVSASIKEGHKFESAKVAPTINKLLAYTAALMIGFLVQENFQVGYPLVQMISSVIGLREIKSVFENLNVLTGVDFLSIISKLPGKPEDKK